MKLNEEERKYIINDLLSNISGISDIEYQKRVWIRGEGPECDDFAETVCRFFDIINSILEEHKLFNISKGQCKLLEKFRDEFDSFCDEHDHPEEFVDSLEWKKIMDMAKEVLELFNYKPKN